VTPTPTPSAAPISIASARALGDGSEARIRGVALTGSAFGDGGGYIADATGGVAVLVTGAGFERGQIVEVVGQLDDRYAQRTLRAAAADLVVLGSGTDPAPAPVGSGSIGESVEGQLIELNATLTGGPSALSGGQAFDADDGSGSVRVFVGDATGIDLAAWREGATIHLRGVVGQRDSSGTGTSGYRVQPRDQADVLAVLAPPTPTPTASPAASVTATPSATPSPIPDVPLLMTIGDARAAATGSRLRVRGVVTLPSGMVEPGSAVIQDASGGILLRLGDETGSLALGELVEVIGTRSTKAGMLTLRVSDPVRRLGSQAEPAPVRLATGAASDDHEAELIVVRGAVTGHVSRSSAGGTSFEIDDGSGPMRVAFSGRASLGPAPATGSWIEVRGPLGQETSGAQPQRGYRVWPRRASDVVVVAAAQEAATGSGEQAGGSGDAAAEPTSGGGSAEPRRPPRLVAPAASAAPDGAAPALGAGRRSTGARAPVGPAVASNVGHGSAGAAGLLIIGLGGALASGTAVLRGGVIGRLWPRPPGSAATRGLPEHPAELEEEMPLTRLSVLGGAGLDHG
jgi:hypothetical protein